MFEEKDGLPVLKIAKSKSSLKKKLQVEVSSRVSEKSDGVILDGCAILWVIHWHLNGTVRDFVDGFNQYVLQKMSTCSSPECDLRPQQRLQHKEQNQVLPSWSSIKRIPVGFGHASTPTICDVNWDKEQGAAN